MALGNKTETIDLTPSWVGLVPFLLDLYRTATKANEILMLKNEFVKLGKVGGKTEKDIDNMLRDYLDGHCGIAPFLILAEQTDDYLKRIS